jgi:hypothetical protein
LPPGDPCRTGARARRDRIGAEAPRAALAATLADADFLADARLQSLPIDPVGGEEAEKIHGAIDAASPDLAMRVRDVLE